MEIKHIKIIKKGNNPTDVKVLVSINPGSFTEFDVLKGQETEIEYFAYKQYVKINKSAAGYNEAIKEGIALLDPILVWIGNFQEKIEGSSEFKDKFYALPMSVKGTEAKTDSQEVNYQTKDPNKPNYIISSNLHTNKLPNEWILLWEQIEIWYGDIKQRETAERLLLRLQSQFTLTKK